MKTREEWIQHWLDKLAGIALRGIVFDHVRADGTPGTLVGAQAAGNYALKLPEKIASLLDEMYVWLEADAQPLSPRSNDNGQQDRNSPPRPAPPPSRQ